MTHIHWVPRQNKLETPKEKDKVKKREVHECDVRTRDPDAMVDPQETQKRKNRAVAKKISSLSLVRNLSPQLPSRLR
jgi:hypothetical protein